MHYLSAGDILKINEREAGENLLADFGLLESAALRPQQTVAGHDAYRTLEEKAAALMHSLIRNHPFVDGNKRTAVLAIDVLFTLNGYELVAEQGDMVALALDIAEGQIDVGGIAATLKGWSRPLELPET